MPHFTRTFDISLLLGLHLLSAVPAVCAQDTPVRHRLDVLLALPTDSAHAVVLSELAAAKLEADTLGEYLLSSVENCDPGVLHSTMRGLRAVLLPTGPDSTRVTFAARRLYWKVNQGCGGAPDDRRWIVEDETGAEGRLWQQMQRVVVALVARGGKELAVMDLASPPDSDFVIASSPTLLLLPIPIDLVRHRVIDVMLSRHLPPNHIDRYQLENHACRDGAREMVHVVLVPQGRDSTRALVAGERVRYLDEGGLDLLGLRDPPCDGYATERTFVVSGDDHPRLLGDLRAIVTALVTAGGRVESAVQPDRSIDSRVKEFRRGKRIHQAVVAVHAPLARVRDEVAAAFGEQRLLPLSAGETRIQWDWCGWDHAAISGLYQNRTVVRAILTPSDSSVTTLVMRVFGADYITSEVDCESAPSPARSSSNRFTSRDEPKTWAHVQAIVERVARLDPDAVPRFDIVTH